uniref:Uncharacterized protein n=1 Tax=Amphiprion ocellaris TaxID=80972 RepID=A0A3Q1B5H1_AMPOC
MNPEASFRSIGCIVEDDKVGIALLEEVITNVKEAKPVL